MKNQKIIELLAEYQWHWRSQWLAHQKCDLQQPSPTLLAHNTHNYKLHTIAIAPAIQASVRIVCFQRYAAHVFQVLKHTWCETAVACYIVLFFFWNFLDLQLNFYFFDIITCVTKVTPWAKNNQILFVFF